MIKRRVDHSFRYSLSENNKRYEGCPVDMGQPSSCCMLGTSIV
ncbi:hypothetical protein [Prevotella pectinovora]